MFQGNAAEVIGKRVGNYVVERTLAQGGMGSVFVARHPALGREAAVKFLGHDFEAPPELTKRFLDEARITASLRHPNIVDIFDFGELDGRLYYVMELLEGCDLSGLMRKRKRVGAIEAVDMLIQIASGLAAAHAVGVVHRDLKPANVFVLDGEPQRLKLMDFGIAKVLSSASEHTSYGQIMGTPRYMSPEQALGQVDRISPQSDIYSLGVIAYEILTGQAPFEHESPVMLLVMHVRDAARDVTTLVPDCPTDLSALVASCLKKDMADRPASASLVVERLCAMRRQLNPRSMPIPRPAAQPSPQMAAANAAASREVRGATGPEASASPKPAAAPRISEPTASESAPPLALVARAQFAHDDTLRRSTAPEPGQVAAAQAQALHAQARRSPKPDAPSPPQAGGKGISLPEFAVDQAAERALKQLRESLGTGDDPLGAPSVPKDLSDAALAPAASAASNGAPPLAPAILYRDAEVVRLANTLSTDDAQGGPEGHTATVQLTETDRSVLNKLLLRMQRKGDFPAFVQNVGEVSKRADFESSFSAQQLGMSILKDYALTAKLLRIVNSAYASRFGGKIYSVQHAIVILGFERVRQLALSISLFKNSGKKEHSERVSESAINSLVSGEISRHLCDDAELDDPEQAVICTMFRNLGRHLVLVYLPELYDQILTLVVQERISLNAASERVLGISMHKLGVGIAERWRLPQRMISAMAVIPERTGKIYREEDRLSALAEFSNQLCEIVAGDLDGAARAQALSALKTKHKHLLTFKQEDLTALLTTVQQSFEKRYESLLGNATKTSRFSQNVSQLIEDASVVLSETSAAASPSEVRIISTPVILPRTAEAPLAGSDSLVPLSKIPTATLEQAGEAPGGRSPKEVVVRGSRPKPAVERLQLTKTVLGKDAPAEPSELDLAVARLKSELGRGQCTETHLSVLLSTMARSLGVRRLLLLRTNAAHRELFIGAGTGDDVEGLSKEMRLPLASARAMTDPFSMAYHTNRPIFIEDCFAAKVMSTMPERYYETVGAKSLMLVQVPGRSGQSYVLMADADPPYRLPTAEALQQIASAREFLGQLAAHVAKTP